MKISVAIVSLSLLSMGLQAQMRKFKAKTNFQSSNTAPTASPANEKDFFGRNMKAATGKKTLEQEKYVNLNPETAFGPEVVTSFDFQNTDLEELTKHMQKLTGINLIWEKNIKGKINILAPSPITVGDAWKAYLTALNVNGLTLVKKGAFYKIENARDARSTPTKIYSGGFTPDVDNYVMKIIPIKNIQSAEIQRNFRPFMSKYGRIINIKQTNTIIVHDTGANINRLQKLISFLDVPGYEESLHIIPVKNSSAQEIAKLLDTILKGSGSSGFRSSSSRSSSSGASAGRSGGNSDISKIIAEPRTNSIIAMANADGIKKLRELILKLDVKYSAASADKIHVYYLNYGSAKELSQTLTNLISGASSGGAGANRAGTSRLSRRRQQQSNNLFSEEIRVTADEANNAIVVTASPTDWLTVEQVIKKLDIPRDQVYVEGLIMETNVTNSKNVGISIVGAYGTGGAQKAGFNPGGVVDLVTNNLTNLSGLFVGGGSGKSVNLELPNTGTVTVDSVSALIRAVASDTNTNVLATPQILALDNEEAEFEVGDEVPINNVATGQNGVTQGSFATQDVKLKLKLTPQINKVTRFIRLKIDQDIKDFSQRDPGNVQQGVPVTTRRAVTTVVVRDRDTIAMGGLMRDRTVDSTTKVPLLGDIPVLGWLFRSNISEVNKINLLFFLTPKILSPYESTTAANLKDVVNRRAVHLKNIHGEDDPYGSTMKGLYQKAEQQAQGPLYDEIEGSRFYQNENVDGGIGSDVNETLPNDGQVPNYKQISEEAKAQTAEPAGVEL